MWQKQSIIIIINVTVIIVLTPTQAEELQMLLDPCAKFFEVGIFLNMYVHVGIHIIQVHAYTSTLKHSCVY